MTATSPSERVTGIYKSAAGHAQLMAWYDRQMARLTPAVESVMIVTRLGETHLLVAGPRTAPPVVLLHGMNLNAAAMAAEISLLAPTHRVYAVDTIGMPGKSAGVRPARRGDGYPNWLLEVLDGLGLEQPAMVGVSFGGWLILKLAALAPERVGPTVLVDSGGLTPFTLRGQAVSGMAALRYLAWPGDATLRRLVAPFYGPGKMPDPSFAELLGLGFRHTRLDVDLAGLPVVEGSALKGWAVPVWVAYGEHDLFFSASAAVARAAAVLPNLAGSEVLPGEGHIWSRPALDRFYRQAADFLLQGRASMA